jgi:Flp pilus assembly protein TadG
MKPLRFLKDTNGAAAAEFVLWLSLLIIPILSVVDLGVFAMQRMQVDVASQAAVQAAWRLCDTPAKLEPASDNCPGLADAITAGAQSTTLGTAVSVASGSPLDGYYCAASDSTLKPAGSGMSWIIGATAPKKPGDCKAVTTGSKTAPGEWVQVTVNFTYAPVFSSVSVASLLPTTISRTAWIRLS